MAHDFINIKAKRVCLRNHLAVFKLIRVLFVNLGSFKWQNNLGLMIIRVRMEIHFCWILQIQKLVPQTMCTFRVMRLQNLGQMTELWILNLPYVFTSFLPLSLLGKKTHCFSSDLCRKISKTTELKRKLD